MKLIEAVCQEQEKRKLNDAQLSHLLKIDAGLWSRIKHEKCPPTRKFLIAVMARLPAVSMEVIDYMRNNGGKGHSYKTEREEA